jgi:type VI secretion system protein ImpI
MQMIMEILNPPASLPERLRSQIFTSAGGLIGRNDDCQWYIPDPKHQLSGQHARISFHDGDFYLTDTSSNGTWEVESGRRLTKERPQRLSNRAVYRLSQFEIGVRLVQPSDLLTLGAGSPLPADSVIREDYLDADPITLLDRVVHRASDDDLSDVLNTSQKIEQHDDHTQLEATHVRVPTLAPAGPVMPPPAPVSATPFWSDFGSVLGIDLLHFSDRERETLAVNAAQLLRSFNTELQRCLRTCAELKHDSRIESDIDLRSDSVAQLVRAPLSASLTQVSRSFRTLQRHQVATHAGSRAALRNAVEQLSPANVTLHFEPTTSRRWFIANGRWKTYCRLYQDQREALLQHPLGESYAHAYNEQQRLLDTFEHLPTGEI